MWVANEVEPKTLEMKSEVYQNTFDVDVRYVRECSGILREGIWGYV